jgi:outer membrane protein assembly factor BamE (lipoprotein component of BamABCDE complex)
MGLVQITRRWAKLAVLMAGAATVLSGCSSIRESRGYIVDPLLFEAVQPRIDNQQSVEATLGRPTFTSQFGTPTWYYVSSITGQRPFNRPRIREHNVLAVQFDEAGRVTKVGRTGVDQVVFLDPEGDKTPTLGRERGFLEDLFGNIGQVGGSGIPGGGGPGGP